MGVVLFNISLRMLHTKKQAPAGRPFVTGLQYVLRETPIGPLFFGSVAKVHTCAVGRSVIMSIASSISYTRYIGCNAPKALVSASKEAIDRYKAYDLFLA